MEFNFIDVAVFVGFIAAVIFVSVFMSRSKKKTSEDYFLAGRGLSWWLIGFSLIAANISTEQFVGMSGNAASHVGLAIASYEWMAAITLVIVGFGFLPYFLRAGIFTMPEFLEYRYNTWARLIMAAATIFIYMILLGSVTYSGALTVQVMAKKMGYEIGLFGPSFFIGLIAMVYVVTGGLKACAWADLLQGSALIVGGAIVMVYAFHKLGGVSEAAYVADVETGAVAFKSLAESAGPVERFWDLNGVRMNMFLPSDDSVLPWTALLLGLWIPNFYYWGLNQYITQRTLGSSSLSHGQKGIVFAAFLKLLIPFVVVIPGIIAFNLFSGDMQVSAALDNASILAKYHKANPQTEFVDVAQAPSKEEIAGQKETSEEWQAALADWKQTVADSEPGRFVVAVCDSAEAFDAASKTNPFVLPIRKLDYEELTVKSYTVFSSDDKAWPHIYPEFDEEIEAYNEQTEAAAAVAGEQTSTEKPIVYKYDSALGQLIGEVLPPRVGLIGFVLAALLGAVVSSLAAMLNAASTIFSMDIYKKYISPQATQGTIVFLGRACVVVFAVIAVVLAPQLGNPNIRNSIFTVIQESQGFVSPGILAVFVFGLVVRRAPAWSGVVGLLTSIATYGIFMLAWPDLQFLNRMALCFAICLLVMTAMRLNWPLERPIEFKQQTTIDLRGSSGARIAGIAVIVLTLILYILFSPLGLAR